MSSRPSPLSPREFLRSLFDAAVVSALPSHNLAAFLPEPPARGRTLVLGAGKAAGAMAAAVDALWPQGAPLSGLVVTRYGHVPPAAGARAGRIEIVEAAHPVPDEAGMAAARRIADLAQGLAPDDLVLCLISGGGSATLALPAPGLTLADKQRINKALLHSGASISEMNCVRKHLSAIKGGHLARLCAPARVVTLCISDVPGDDPAIIASGPTVPDATTCADALRILQRHAIAIPEHVRAALEDGTLETPKPGDACFARTSVHLVATPRHALEAAARAALEAGVTAHILSDEIEGESHVVGRVHGALARAVALRDAPFRKPCVILSGGETSVTVNARGGRPRRPRDGVSSWLRPRAAGDAGRARACRGHRRHRRRRRQRRRLRRTRYPGPRRVAEAQGPGIPRPQRRPRVLRTAGRLARDGADLYQRQRLPRVAGALTPTLRGNDDETEKDSK